ncbi:hypothetical protein V2J09_024206 [Rumex salicifolius]
MVCSLISSAGFVQKGQTIRVLSRAFTQVHGVTEAKKEEEVKEVEGDVKMQLKLLITTMATHHEKPPLELHNLIDAIERLGLGYRLEDEIELAVQTIFDHTKHEAIDDDHHFDLYHICLWFRLLRQHGFHGQDGRLKDSLASDVKGILALYEASHVSIHGDDTLDEALVFSTAHLNDVATNQQDHPLASQLAWILALYEASHLSIHGDDTLDEALVFSTAHLNDVATNQPNHPLASQSRHLITFYEQHPSHDKTLLKYSELDFNRVQALHKELRDLTRWWKDLDLNGKMPFPSRDRVPEAYFWTLGLGPYFEPQYAVDRKIFSQVFKITSIVDDIYDAYGTIDELTPFTKAIEGWDRSYINELPEYMKVCYESLLNTYEEFECDLAPEGRSWCVEYARAEVSGAMRNTLLRATSIWRKAAIISFGYNTGTVVSYLGMGNVANKEAFEWARGNPKAIRSTAIIGRLMDDMASHQFEQRRKHVPSAVECYMKEHGVKEEIAHKELGKRPYEMPKPLLTRILNLCRIVDVIYKGEDCYTFSKHTMKNNISLILTDPIPI